MSNHGGGRKNAGRKTRPKAEKKVPIPVSTEQRKLNYLLLKYGGAKKLREIYEEFTNTLIS
ncbi:MAG: hypothetical protein GY928_14710 [Colwellia sp.]|nr:hypothetical protein [Colwellia sp.]